MSATTTTEHGLTVGSLLVSRWGYDQTNVDFYEVTRATAKTVLVRPIAARREPGQQWGRYRAAPERGAFTGEAFRCKVQDPEGNPFVKINSVAIATPTTESSVSGTDYA